MALTRPWTWALAAVTAGLVGVALAGAGGAAAGLYGVAAAAVPAALTRRHLRRARGLDPAGTVRQALRCEIERLGAAALLLAAGLAALRLEPLSLLAGFLAGQAGAVAGGYLSLATGRH